MVALLAVVSNGIPHSMPQGGKSYHRIFKKPPLVRGRTRVLDTHREVNRLNTPAPIPNNQEKERRHAHIVR
jgi:hypothetical protein